MQSSTPFEIMGVALSESVVSVEICTLLIWLLQTIFTTPAHRFLVYLRQTLATYVKLHLKWFLKHLKDFLHSKQFFCRCGQTSQNQSGLNLEAIRFPLPSVLSNCTFGMGKRMSTWFYLLTLQCMKEYKLSQYAKAVIHWEWMFNCAETGSTWKENTYRIKLPSKLKTTSPSEVSAHFVHMFSQ